MKSLKRCVSMILAAAMVVQSPLAALAEKRGDSDAVQNLQRHTITLYADTGTEKLVPLTSESTQMEKRGDVLRNVEGVAEVSVQSIYDANQTLASVSLAGTGFSFAPQMLEEYFLAAPTEAPTSIPETPLPSETPQPDETETPTEIPETTEIPVTEAPAQIPETPAPSEILQPEETDAPTQVPETPAPSETPLPEETEAPTESLEETELPTSEPIPPSLTEETTETPAAPSLASGYAKTLRTGQVFASQYGQEMLGTLSSGAIVYIITPANTGCVQLIFDTEQGVVEGYLNAEYLVNLTEAEKEQTLAQIARQETIRSYHAYPLLCEERFIPAVPPTDEPKEDAETASPEPVWSEPPASPAPTETVSPTETPNATETPDVTEEPNLTEAPSPTPEPEIATKTDLVGALLHVLSASALAEDELTRPTRIQGQMISGRARSSGGVQAVVYPGLFDAVTDVRLSVTTTGVKEDIIVGEYTSNHVYTYRLDTEGLTAQQSGQEILLYYENGQALAKLEAPNMRDADGNYSTDIAVSLTGSGGHYTVTYRPNDDWMKTASYPVTIDPTGNYFNNLSTGIGDAYVSSANPSKHYAHTVKSGSPQQDHSLEGTNLHAGNDGDEYIAYIIPSLSGFEGNEPNVQGFPTDEGILIEEAVWHVLVHEIQGDGRFTLSLVTSGWNVADVTYQTKPAISSAVSMEVKLTTGWNSVDVTPLFSAWFNTLNQKQNWGFAVTSSTSKARICSSDVWPRDIRMNFSATYYTGVTAPALTAHFFGHGVNSESGWADLSWNRVEGAQGYVVGIYNGREYEYRFVGDVTSFSTKGLKLWPTDAEIAAGQYALHWDGRGQELPTIPRADQADLNYYFMVMPSNSCGQVAGSDTIAYAHGTLPDTMPPNQPAAVAVDPAGWTNAATAKITWAGILDMPLKNAALTGGSVQYAVDPSGSDPTKWTWQPTGAAAANGTCVLDTSAWADGTHAIYIRGVDANGNYGIPKGTSLRLDRTGPTAPQVTAAPAGWTNQKEVLLSWGGMDDLNAFRVEYQIDNGAYIDTGKKDGNVSGFPLDLTEAPEGMHTISVRGVDALGNAGQSGQAQVRIDRSAPTLASLTLNPSGWTKEQQVTLAWTGAKDAVSGLKEIACQLDGGAYHPLPLTERGTQMIDVSTLADGAHTVRLRLTDYAGLSAIYQANIQIDRMPPTIGMLELSPSTWTADASMAFDWTDAQDAHSGLTELAYAIDEETYLPLTATKNGQKMLDVSAMPEGEHALSLQLTDGVGLTAKLTKPFFIDRTPPELSTLTVSPDGWSNEQEVTLTWTGAVDEVSGLKELTCSLDGGEEVVLEPASNGTSTVDTAGLADGLHTVALRLTDMAGISSIYEQTIYVDRTAPDADAVEGAPEGWSDTDTIRIAWADANDPHSGLASIEYQVDDEEERFLLTLSGSAEETLNVSSWEDGQHAVTLLFTDGAGNSAARSVEYQLDRTPPEVSLLSPVDGATVSGVLDIQGTVQDISLRGWTLEAAGTSGTSVKISGTTEEKDEESLGVLDTALFADGEEIEVSLTAWDEAGHRSVASGVYIKAVHQAQPVSQEVKITAPKTDAVLSENFEGQYTLLYPVEESEESAYLDGRRSGAAANGTILLYPILYPEESTHTLTVISVDKGGRAHYSQGYQSVLLTTDLLQDDHKLTSHQGLTFAQGGATVTSDQGELITQEIVAPRPISAIRLHLPADDGAKGAIAFYWSVDGGDTWQAFRENQDAVFDAPQRSIMLRCQLFGQGTTLRGFDLTGIYEANAVQWRARLLKPVHSFAVLSGNRCEAAKMTVEHTCERTLAEKRLYLDGDVQGDDFELSALPMTEGKTYQVALLGLDESGALWGSGAEASVLLRAAPRRSGDYESGVLTPERPLAAIRVEALCMNAAREAVDAAVFAYSLDGEQWTELVLENYALLPRLTEKIYLRADLQEGTTLEGLHVEGVTLRSWPMTPHLVEAPCDVKAYDYGAFDEDERRYELTWRDEQAEDMTVSNDLVYDVYRNGEKIATTSEQRYVDMEYEPDAVYQVAARRIYSDPMDGRENQLERSSSPVEASVQRMEKPIPPVIVTPTPRPTPEPTPNPTPEPSTSAPGLTSTPTLAPIIVTPTPGQPPVPTLPAATRTPRPTEKPILDFTTPNNGYGGDYTADHAAHQAAPELDQSLLGPHRFCSLGFEPINFNTGNFFLQASDFVLADGTSRMDWTRTYNSQSLEEDTPFGSGWASEITQHLHVADDGSVAWRRADGSEIRFVPSVDGHYTSNSTEYEQLIITEDGYQISCTDGTAYAFAPGGCLMRVERRDGQQRYQFIRDEKTQLTAIELPGGITIDVQTDKHGHITRITLPGGETISYAYRGSQLASVTDAAGSTVRYQYNQAGLMTAWYDGNGIRQVENTYDDQRRVIAQRDAGGGEYRLQYEEQRTITTDAEGNTCIYERNASKRTTRIVDAMGGVTTFTYGEQGEIISKSDPLDHLTVYAYDTDGNKISETDPRGATVFMTWDDDHHLLSLTDQNGNTTAYTYDERGNLLTETAPDGGQTTYAYDAQGQLIARTDALGGRTEYTYEAGQVTKITDPLGNKTCYTYDANGHLASMTDALGYVTLYDHDARGNLLTLTFADGTQVKYTYDAQGRQTSMTNPLGGVTKYAYDKLGNLIKTTLPDGTTQTAAYTKDGQLQTVTDALGNRTKYTYDGNGHQLTMTDPMGNRTACEYDAAGNLLRETNPLGGVTAYTYDEAGLPLTMTDPTGAAQSMTYDSAGNLLTRTLAGGAEISTAYDSMKRPVRQENALGGVTELVYDLLGRITSVTDPLGAQTTYTYDANGNLLTVTDALGQVTAYVYDALNRIVSETAPNGAVTRYESDSVGNLTAVTDALGGVTRYQYDANGNLTGVTDALGQTVSLTYDKNGNATKAIQKNGAVLATAYDSVGRAISETDANGNTTRYSYNQNGFVTKVTDALGQQATFTYDAQGNVVKITAPGNAITLYVYDSAGRTMSMTDAEGCTTTYSYNAAGQLERLTENGNATLYEYDAAGNVSAVTDAEGRRIAFSYDANGNLTEVIYPDRSRDTTAYDALGRVVKSTPRTGLATAYEYDAMGNVIRMTRGEQVTSYEYDLLNRLTSVTAPDGTTTLYAYDDLGNLISETDPLGHTTSYSYTAESLLEQVTYANGATQSLAYDAAGNVTAETDGEGNTKRYRYDRVNRLISATDEMGNRTSYQYDAQDNIAKVTDALQRVTRYTYDKNGNLLTETDALGNRVKYSYTPEGWLERMEKADGTALTFEYDRTGSLQVQHVGEGQSVRSSYNALGMVTEVSSAEGTIFYQYNEQGNLVSVTNVNGDVVSYTYDVYGNKTSMTYPDGRAVHYSYDSMNRMTKVIGLDGEETCYSYDAAGRRTETTSGTLTTAYSYDDIGNLLAQVTTGEREIAYRYSYNRNGNITGEVRTEGDTTTESTYAYDALGQLTSFMQSTGYGESYTYDRVGNMTKKVISGMDGGKVALSMAYNKGNQMVGMSNGQDRIAYSYDKNGSMVKKVLTSRIYGTLTDSYTYNSLDQLTSYTGYDGYQQVFTYDANGMRLTKSQKGNANRSTLEELLRGNISGLPEVIVLTEAEEEYSWATTEYLYDLTQEYYQVIQKNRADETTVYEYGMERIAEYTNDAKHSYVYDGRGSVVLGAAYTPFGEQMGVTKVSGYSYNAEDYDAATGMLNLRARQYEPAMNRFSQKDIVRGQVTSPLSLNRYAYCANNPTLYGDPSGNSLVNKLSAAWNKAKQTTVGSFINKVVVQPVKSAAKVAKAVVSPIVNVVTKAWNNTVPIIAQMWQEMAAVDESRPTCKVERQIIQERACARLAGDAKRANELSTLLANVSKYTANEWRFLVSDIFSENDPASEDYIDIGIRMAILDRLKENGGFISPEELVEVGLYSANTTALTKQMGSGFIEMSYRLTQQGDSFWSMNLQIEEQRTGQLYSLINYMAFMYVSDYNDAFRSSGNAIRMDGATVAAPGYESSPSDSLPFDYTGTRYDINISNQTMYQLGSHFNSHGKPEMGYASKKEYQQAAYEFALEARKASDTKIYIGTWNGRGNLNNTQQIIMQRDGKSIIINSKTGQIIDFYVGTDNLGFINIVEWR